MIFFCIAFFSLMFFSQNGFAVNEICATNFSCCTAPPIIELYGGCATGEHWIGSETTGSCQTSAVTCVAPSNFNCASGACTSISTPGTGCAGWQLNLGSGTCVDPLKIIKDTVNPAILKIYNGGYVGNVVYIPQPVSCSTGEVPVWNNSTKKWDCSIDDWTKNIASSFLSYIGKVAINIADPGTYTLYVNGDTNITGNLTVAGDKKGLAAKYVGLTAIKKGANGGYASADAFCTPVSAGSHICTAKDITNSYVSGVAMPASGVAWINNGPPGYVKYVTNDCDGWNSSLKTIFGSVWNFSKKASYVADCGQSVTGGIPFACCK